MKATAFIGVIAFNEGLAYYETHEKSVDKFKFVQFLKNFHRKHRQKKYIFLWDRLTAHTSLYAKKHCQDNNVEYVLAATGCPDLNAIEYLFSKLK
jgi:transposase